MKKIIFVVSILFMMSCSSDNNSEIPEPQQILSIQQKLDSGIAPLSIFQSGSPLDSLYGKKFEGGFIYYLNTSTGEGLVAHWQDNSSAYSWGGSGDVTAANSIEIGSGQINSNSIMDYYFNNTAADFCANLNIEGYDDWFLPSLNEMKEMHKNLINRDGFYFGASTGYWTSSNIDYLNVWIINHSGTGQSILKNTATDQMDVRIRATRKF